MIFSSVLLYKAFHDIALWLFVWRKRFERKIMRWRMWTHQVLAVLLKKWSARINGILLNLSCLNVSGILRACDDNWSKVNSHCPPFTSYKPTDAVAVTVGAIIWCWLSLKLLLLLAPLCTILNSIQKKVIHAKTAAAWTCCKTSSRPNHFMGWEWLGNKKRYWKWSKRGCRSIKSQFFRNL